MRRSIGVLVAIGIVGCLSLLAVPVDGQLVRPGTAAPEITGGPWIGSDPLTTQALRGRVVLVEFWTFG